MGILQIGCKPAALGSPRLGSPRLGSPRLGSPRGLPNRSFSSFTMETRYSESNSSTQDEIGALRAENKELSAQASKAVEMNVEITSLKNQVSACCNLSISRRLSEACVQAGMGNSKSTPLCAQC